MKEISEEAQESVRQLRETNARYDEELQQCKDRTEVYLQRLHDSDAAVETCTARTKYYEAESSRLRSLNENLTDDNERLLEKYTSLEIRCADMRRDFDAFRAEMAIQGPAAAEENTRYHAAPLSEVNTEVNAELEEKVHNLEARNTELSASNARLLSDNEAAAADIEQIQPILRECSEDKRELEHRREMTNEMVDELKAKDKELKILSYKLQCISTKPRGLELLNECEQSDELSLS
jgi:chromosome segregation ATPase